MVYTRIMKSIAKPIYLIHQYDKNKRIFAQRHDNTTSHLLHFHDCYEITCFISGNGIHHLNGEDYIISKNNVFLLTPKDYHSLFNLSAHSSFINIMFSKKIIDDKIYQIINMLKRKHLTITQQAMNQLVPMFSTLEDLLNSPTYYSDEFYQNFLFVFLTIIAHNSSSKNSLEIDLPHQDSAFQKVISYINENFQNNINLKSTADSLGYSYVYLSKLFKNKTGLCFNEYVNMLKIEQAKKLLLTTNETIYNISYKCGFFSQTTFLRNFSLYTNMTPSEYIAKHQK